MTTPLAKTTVHTQSSNAKHNPKISYSAATIAVAKLELEKAEFQSDEAFLIRAEMDKKISSL